MAKNVTFLVNCLSLTEDGNIVFNSAQNDITKPLAVKIDKENQVIQAFNDEGVKIIEKYDLNGKYELPLRIKIKELIKDGNEKLPEYCRIKAKHLAGSLSNVGVVNRTAETHHKETGNLLRRLVYANIITSLEAFLYELLRAELINKKRGKSENEIDEEIRKIENIVYHRKDLVERAYKRIFNVDLPSCEFLNEPIKIRHDIIHRNGKKKDNDADNIKIEIRYDQIVGLMYDVIEFSKDLINRIGANYS